MEYQVQSIDDHTWIIKEKAGSFSSYLYLLCGYKKAALIDTGLGSIPLDQICRKMTSLPIDVILTHGHFDHIGGSGWFENVYMSELDENIFKRHSDHAWKLGFCGELLHPVAKKTISFPEDGMIDLGDRRLKVIASPGHTPGSVCILDESRRALFTGDTCCNAHVLLQTYNEEFLHEADKRDPNKIFDIYEASLLNLLAMRDQYDITWPSHHSIPVGIEIMEDFLEAVRLLKRGELNITVRGNRGHSFQLARYKGIGIEF